VGAERARIVVLSLDSGQNTRDSRALLPLAVEWTYWHSASRMRSRLSRRDERRAEFGNLRITYVNQSTDTLRDFYVHQY